MISLQQKNKNFYKTQEFQNLFPSKIPRYFLVLFHFFSSNIKDANLFWHSLFTRDNLTDNFVIAHLFHAWSLTTILHLIDNILSLITHIPLWLPFQKKCCRTSYKKSRCFFLYYTFGNESFPSPYRFQQYIYIISIVSSFALLFSDDFVITSVKTHIQIIT